MKTKKIINGLEVEIEESTASAPEHVPIATPSNNLYSLLLELLMFIFSGKTIEPEKIPQEVIKEASRASGKIITAQELAKDAKQLKSAIFKTIKNNSREFIKNPASTATLIIYDHPDYPNDKTKSVSYLWNEQSKSWRILAGENASCAITDEKSGGIINLENGSRKIYGKTESLSFASEQDVSAYASTALTNLMGEHPVFSFELKEDSRIDRYFNGLEKATCNKSRANLMAEMLKGNEQLNYNGSIIPQKDKNGDTIFWQDVADAKEKIGLKIKADKTIDVLLPKNLKGREFAFLLIHKDIDTNNGAAGGQIVHINKAGEVRISSNTPYKDRAGIPKLSGKAIEITSSMEENKEITKKEEKPSPRIEQPKTEKALGKTDALTLPDWIKVTGPNGENNFELHCAFNEQNCVDGNWNKCEATVYVMKKTGATLDKHRMADALIIEVRKDNGDIMLRAGNDQDPFNTVKAKVSVQKETQLHVAEIGLDDDKKSSKITYKADSPFKEAGNDIFMCVDNCCGYYSSQNKDLMKTGMPAVGKGFAI